MFAYLRIFSAISLVVVVIAAIFVGMYFRSTASNDLTYFVGQNNQALTYGFVNTVWEKHGELMKQLVAVPKSDWATYGYQLSQTQEYADFRKDAFDYLNDLDVIKLVVYSKSGNVMLTSNNANILSLENSSDRFRQAFKGKASHTMLPNSKFDLPSGTGTTGTLIHSLLPVILSDNQHNKTCVPVLADYENTVSDCVDGVIEIYSNITPQWDQLYQFQVIGTAVIITIFMVLLGALFFTSKRAESIIARQHETNLELAAQAASAEAENREKSQFLANVSHELRTPLNAIIGFSEIIKNEVMGPLGNLQYQDYIRDIHSSGVHLLSLINDILDYSKAEAGKLDLEIGEVDCTKIVQNSLRLVSPRAEAGNILLVDDMPKEHFVMTTDAKKFKQVMLNLLSNAVKFTPTNGSVRVTAIDNTLDDSVTFEVSDTGIGIAPKDIAKAMAPFGQVDSALSRKYEGTGLGLPLTRKFVEIMGGKFNITSEVGAGTTITFTLPKHYGKQRRIGFQ